MRGAPPGVGIDGEARTVTAQGVDERITAVLERPLVAILGTVSPSGSPQLTAVWYAVRDGELVISTAASSQKVRNIRENPAVELCVNAGPVGPCVTCRGVARIVGPASTELVAELARRYLGDEGGKRYMASRTPKSESVLISVVPHAWRVWDIGTVQHEGRS